MAASTDPGSMMTAAHRAAAARIIDKARRAQPRLALLREIERPADMDEARVAHLIQMWENALAMDEAHRQGAYGV